MPGARRVLVGAAATLALATAAGGATSAWEERAPLPLPRTEVSAAVVGSEIVVLGGLTDDGGASRRVDAYAPARDTWRRLPDLPVGVHHSAAVGANGKLYVLGGYTAAGATLRSAFVLERGALAPPGAHAIPARGSRRGCRRTSHRGRGRNRRGAPPREERALLRPRHGALVGRRRSDAARAPGRDVLRRHGLRGRRSHGGPRHQPPPLRELPARGSRDGAGSSPSRIRVAEPEPRRSPGRSSRSAARSPEGRSPRCSRTASRRGAGCSFRTCRRRVTAWASPRSADRSS